MGSRGKNITSYALFEELKHLRGRVQQGLSLGPAAMSPMISGLLFDLGPLTEKLHNQEMGSPEQKMKHI